MLGTHLHLTLRSLCLNTEWKYAVFWKLKHRTRMKLTWEDAYYDHHEQPSLESSCFSDTPYNLRDGHYRDPLGLAVAKMSYHVYSLGEGIVGQVAVTGQHQWIFADKQATNFSTFLESSDGWQTQFHAGIRTVVVVAVVPHGVVQLGSLNKVAEDLKLVNHVKNVFYTLQSFSVGYTSNPVQCSIASSLFVPDVPTASSCSEVFQNCPVNRDKSTNQEMPNACPSMYPSLGRDSNSSYSVSVPSIHQEKALEVINKQIESELSKSRDEGNSKLFKSPKQVQVGETSNWRDTVVSKQSETPDPHSAFLKTLDLYDLVEHSGVNFSNYPLGLLNSAILDQGHCNDVDDQPSHMEQQRDLGIKLEQETYSSCIDSQNTSLKFSACSELHEALGSAFFDPDAHHDFKAETTFEMPEGMSSCQSTSDFGSDNLLEAVVANVCQSVSEVKREKSFCQSMQSFLTTERKKEASSYVKHTIGSVSYSIDRPSLMEDDSKHCSTSSDVCGARSPTGFSSTCPSACSEQLERSAEPTKTKKRARAGENSRPRPRDRQLIQDRIKELRELVPNGSKCSIDSLLERTIKHMLFMQSVTKYADKMKECAESKLCNKDRSMLESSTYEQGSSWAVEVGSHLKVCPIVVENLNMNGRLLVEMLCEECSHFLEIAEAIRSLGLMILKGITEVRGEKTWICFVVEGENNRTIHRMDVLWSLVQILQPKTKV